MDPLLVHIPNELLTPAATACFEGCAHLPGIEVGPGAYADAADLSWRHGVTDGGEALQVEGSVQGTARTSCARCLEDVTIDFDGEIWGYFLTGGEDAAAPEGMDEDEYELLPDSHTIDMGVLVKAAVLLELPLVPLCDADCKGLCPTCGANLNDGPCGCAAPEPDEDFELAKNPFAALKGLTFDENDGTEA